MLWEEILSGDFEKAVEEAKGVCAIVVGCVEHHGKHLPLGQDVIHGMEIAKRAAEKEPVVIFPPQYFGEKQGAGEFKGTIIFSSKLIFDILTETCDEIGRNGFKKIVIISSHGGNSSMLNNFARSTLYSKKDYSVVVYQASNAWPKVPEILSMVESGRRDVFPDLLDSDIEFLKEYVENNTDRGHGCLMETAIALGTRPELVDLSRVNNVSGSSTHLFDHLSKAGFYSPHAWMANYPNSLASNYHDGNNERIAKSAVRFATDKMASAFKLIKEDTVLENYHNEWLKKQ